MVRLPHSADPRSRLRHVSSAPSVAYCTGLFPRGHPSRKGRLVLATNLNMVLNASRVSVKVNRTQNPNFNSIELYKYQNLPEFSHKSRF